MKRNVDMNEISDGRLYSSGDMVKADCHDCQGCSDCCRGMGNSIILDPMDVWRIQKATKKDFTQLMADNYTELSVVDGMILPNLKMDAQKDACPFLSSEGRCSIHSHRPGFCRMFPLGRCYEENGFKYFIQIHECSRKNRGKVKIKKWLDIPNLKVYESYIAEWHDFLVRCENALESLNDENTRTLTLYVLRRFYETSYMGSDDREFYAEFRNRLSEIKEKLGI